MQILHIEDQTRISHVFSQILENKGYQYQSTSNAKNGLELILQYNYDLILLDLEMPKFSGFDLLNELNQKQPEKIQNIIILTGLDLSLEQKRNLKSLGVKSIEAKPISIQKLLERIASVKVPLVK